MSRPQWREQNGDRLITGTVEWNAVNASTLIVGLLALAWLVSYGLGGSKSVGPQLFHIPIVLAAIRFGAPGGAIVALVAGVICGPFLPLEVEDGSTQPAANWLGRVALFMVVAQIVAAFQSRSVAQTTQRHHDQRSAAEIERAVAQGQFVPAFQPIVNLHTGRIEGAEALARWVQPNGEVVPPAQFVPRAERSGAIVAIDRTILRLACQQLVRWRRSSEVSEQFYLSVNVSAENLQDSGFAGHVAAVVAETGVDPWAVLLEITETALVDDPEAAVAVLRELKELGVRIALDDFGVGQSSLGNLARFPIDCLKIDRSFVAAMGVTPRGVALVAGVLTLAESLSLETPVVEGIETVEQFDILVANGCQRGQGFLLGRPTLAPEVGAIFQAGLVDLPRGR